MVWGFQFRSCGLRQGGLYHAQPVLTKDACQVVIAVTLFGKQGSQHLQVGNRIHLMRNMLPAEPAVKVGADADVTGIPGDLADVVDVGGYFVQ